MIAVVVIWVFRDGGQKKDLLLNSVWKFYKRSSFEFAKKP